MVQKNGPVNKKMKKGKRQVVRLQSRPSQPANVIYAPGRSVPRPVMARKAKGDRITAALTGGKLTRDGANWLRVALDPFHDVPQPIAGYPDADGSATVVSCYKYTANVTKPAGALGNWDAHFFTLPFTAQILELVSSSLYQGELTQTVAGTNWVTAVLNVAKADSGQPLFPNAAPFVSTNFSITAIDPAIAPVDLSSGVARILGMGFEVHNDTASIHKQGGCIAYRMPQHASQGGAKYVNGAGTVTGKVEMDKYRALPSTPQDAMRMADSLEWEAKDGCYVHCTQQTIANPLTAPTKHYDYLSQDSSNADGAGLLTTTSPYTAKNVAPAESTLVSNAYCRRIPFNSSGVFFTGLSNETSLRVTMRVYLEKAPELGDNELLPLATPSAGYDVNALALYAKVANELPVAVKVGENGAGDFFRRIGQAIEAVVSAPAAAIDAFIPGVSRTVGSVTGTIRKGGDGIATMLDALGI